MLFVLFDNLTSPRKLIQSPFFSKIIYRIKIYIIQWQTQQILKTITPVLK